MMQLTDDDRRILDGEQGEVKRKALELLLTLARIYDADSLVPIDSAHINGASIVAVGMSEVSIGGGSLWKASATAMPWTRMAPPKAESTCHFGAGLNKSGPSMIIRGQYYHPVLRPQPGF